MKARKEKYFHLIVGGGLDYGVTKYDDIYKYDAEADQWSMAGKMQSKRRSHAVSTVSKQDILPNCQ